MHAHSVYGEHLNEVYFREGPKKVCHGQQLAEELLALERLQQGDCAQVSFYIHNLAFIWLTNVLVLQLIYTWSSIGTQGDRVQLDFNFGAAVSASSEVASGSRSWTDPWGG